MSSINCIFAIVKPGGSSSNKLTVQIRHLLQRHSVTQSLHHTSNQSVHHSIKPKDEPSIDSTTVLPAIHKLTIDCHNQQASSQSIAFITKKVKPPWFRVGHGGTLDLEATGVLVIGVGRGCQSLDKYLKQCSKTYVVTAQLGSATDTFDSAGTVIPNMTADYQSINQSDIENLLPEFIGHITQQPPVYSALTVGGMRGYHYARAEAFEWAHLESMRPPARAAFIKSCELLSFNKSTGRFSLSVETGSGVYIRTLIDDIGRKLKCYAHVTKLCRTKQGEFMLSQSIKQSIDRDCVAMEMEQVTINELERRSKIWTILNPVVIKQKTKPSINQPINQSIDQSDDESLDQQIDSSVNEVT